MNIQRLSILVGLGVFTFATAQTPPVASTFGRGVVVNAANRRGEFNFEVVKRIVANTNEPAVRGRFEFNLAGENANQRVRIVMERAVGLGVVGRVAEFGGLGFMVRQGPNGPIRVNGRIAVRVEDVWNPPTDNPGDGTGTTHPFDKFAVRFFVPSNTSPNGQQVFDFGGDVKRGNLVVRGGQAGGGN